MKTKTHLLAAMIILFTACGGSLASRTNEAIGTALTATNAARDQFSAWDEQHQLAIVDKAETREQAEEGLKGYRRKRQRIVQAFTVAYSSMAAASALVPLVLAGEKKNADLIKLLTGSVMAVQSVISSISEIREAFDTATPPATDTIADPDVSGDNGQ